MARLWNVGTDGVVFINFLKPAKNLLLKAKTAPPHVKVIITIAAAAVAVGGIGYYIYKKLFPPKKKHHSLVQSCIDSSNFVLTLQVSPEPATLFLLGLGGLVLLKKRRS